MAKTMILKDTDSGLKYTLEYTRKSIEQMERAGFRSDSVKDMPVSMVMMLVEGAFKAHHSSVSKDVIEKLFSRVKNKNDFIGKLAEMYTEPVQTLMGEPVEDVGNVDWAVDW